MSDEIIRTGDWVQLPAMPNPHASYRLGKVIEVNGVFCLVSIAKFGEVTIAAVELKKITWATPYEPAPAPSLTQAGGDGPFCPCGEPVGLPGAACRVCRREEFETEWSTASFVPAG
jgi:hypothetical protein